MSAEAARTAPLRWWGLTAILSVAATDEDRARKAIARHIPDPGQLSDRYGLDVPEVAKSIGVDVAVLAGVLESGNGPPAVMLDTEDAIVGMAARRRDAIVAAAQRLTDSDWWEGTLRLVRLPAVDRQAAELLLDKARNRWPDGVVLPKAERPELVAAVREAVPPDVHIVLLVESPAGVERLRDLIDAAGDRLGALMFGAIDYAAGAGLATTAADPSLVAWARAATVNAAAAAGVPAIDGMVADFPVAPAGASLAEGREHVLGRMSLVSDHARGAARLGMAGTLVGHPLQLLAAVTAFADASRPERVARWEADVRSFGQLTATGLGVGLRDGSMVDGATDRLARVMLRRAAAVGTFDLKCAVDLGIILPAERTELGRYGRPQ